MKVLYADKIMSLTEQEQCGCDWEIVASQYTYIVLEQLHRVSCAILKKKEEHKLNVYHW